MPAPYQPFIPKTVSELIEQLGWMTLFSPKFENDSGYFPGRNLDTTFFSLNEGLKANRNRLGEERYVTLLALSDRMRAHFEADPEDETDDGLAGLALIDEMMDILKSLPRRKPVAANDPGTPASVPPKGA